MAAPILWTPGKMPSFWGGGGGDLGLGGGEVPILFLWARGNYDENKFLENFFVVMRVCFAL